MRFLLWTHETGSPATVWWRVTVLVKDVVGYGEFINGERFVHVQTYSEPDRLYAAPLSEIEIISINV